MKTTEELLAAADELRRAAGNLNFGAPVTHVYNPLDYAWDNYAAYVKQWATGPRQVVMLGMNPGPWGMAQTGVPFGVVWAVRDWMRLPGRVGQPERAHPRRPVLGYACPRTEVSGDRLWGWARERWETPERFFERFFVLNYCPLSFMDRSGRNVTPDRLPAAERDTLIAVCDRHLARALEALQPRAAVGVGRFAEERLRAVLKSELDGSPVAPVVVNVPHPSPANPAANRGWAALADEALSRWGIVGGDHRPAAR
ncbi:MAG: single-stranded DNA-binding protein [Candidatus Sumerlaeia bacterium]